MAVEMTPGGLFKALRDPLGTAWDMAKGAANPEALMNAPGMLEKVTGFAGRSIIVDPTQEATEKLKNPKGVKRDFFSTIFHFLKKRVATWGILAGVISWLASIGIGKYQSSVENPNPLLGTISMVAKALIFAGPAASIYGQVMRNVEKTAGIDPSIFLRGKGNDIINELKLAKKVGEKDLKEAKEKTIVLSPSEKSTEDTILQNISQDKPVKSIIMGPESSCKSTLANKIAAQISEMETNASTNKRTVVVETIDCINVVAELRQQASQDSPVKGIVNAVASQMQIPTGAVALSGEQLAEAIIYGIEQRIDEAKSQNNERRVILLTNVERLWWLAVKKDNSIDSDLILKIQYALCNLLSKDNKYDIVITSNMPGDKTLGLHTIYAEHLKQPNLGEDLARCVDALDSESITISALDDTTRTQAIASAIAQKLNISDERAIRRQISEAIEYRIKGRLNEIDSEFEAAIKSGQEFYIEDHIQKIKDFYTAEAKFKNLGSGDIYSLMDKVTVPDNVKTKLLTGNDDEKKKAALYIIDELITRSRNLDSEERKTVEGKVQGKISNLGVRKTNIEQEIRNTNQAKQRKKDILRNLELQHTERINKMLGYSEQQMQEAYENPVQHTIIIKMMRDFESLGDLDDPTISSNPLIVNYIKLMSKL